MAKIGKQYIIALILVLIEVFLCQNPAYALRAPLQFNKVSKELIVKERLIETKFLMEKSRGNKQEALSKLEELGSCGMTRAVVVRHKVSGKSIILLGAADVGRASTASMLIEGIGGKLNSLEWELVAHWGVIFVFVDNKAEQLFIIQDPEWAKEGLWSSHLKGKSNIKPSGEPVHVDGIAWYLKDLGEENWTVKRATSEMELRKSSVHQLVTGLVPSPDVMLQNELIISDLPIISVKRTDKDIETALFEDMVVEIHDLVYSSIISKPASNENVGGGETVLKEIEARRSIARGKAQKNKDFEYTSWDAVPDYLLILKLFHAKGVLKGKSLYFSIGNDYLLSYFTRTFGTNSGKGLKSDPDNPAQLVEDIAKLEEELLSRTDLPKDYKAKPKNIEIFNCNNFDYKSYFPEISKEGGINVLFIKGLTEWIIEYSSFPGAGHFSYHDKYTDKVRKTARSKIRGLIIKTAKKLLNEGGFIFIASANDLWIAEIIKEELGYLDLLEQPEYEEIKKVLKYDVCEYQDYLGDAVKLVSGRVPIRVFQKPPLSQLSKNISNVVEPTDL